MAYYIAPGVFVGGDVVLGDDVALWPNAVVRGDMGRVALGDCCNVHDSVGAKSAAPPYPSRPTALGSGWVYGDGVAGG